MKTSKAIQILTRRVEHLRARAVPGDTGKSYDLAEISALELAISTISTADIARANALEEAASACEKRKTGMLTENSILLDEEDDGCAIEIRGLL